MPKHDIPPVFGPATDSAEDRWLKDFDPDAVDAEGNNFSLYADVLKDQYEKQYRWTGSWVKEEGKWYIKPDTKFPEDAEVAEVAEDRFTHIRGADGAIYNFNTRTGKRGDIPLLPAGPAQANIEFFTDPNTSTFYAYDTNQPLSPGGLITLTVISKEKVPSFGGISSAVAEIDRLGLESSDYHYVYSEGRVDIQHNPAPHSSFTVVKDARGQAFILDTTTGTTTKLGEAPATASVPPEAKVEIDELTGQFKITQPDGRISFPSGLATEELATQELEEINIGGQSFAFNPTTGQMQQVKVPEKTFDPGIVTEGGRAFIRDKDGNLTPLGREEVPNLDELITSRILAGDASGALALANFRDRPTSLEAFNAAMQYAQAPGDVAAISAIARGETLVAPPPTGTVQRIAEQPEFLQDTYKSLIAQFRGGTGSPKQFIDVLTAINKENYANKAALEASIAQNRRLRDAETLARANRPVPPTTEVPLPVPTTGEATEVPLPVPTTGEATEVPLPVPTTVDPTRVDPTAIIRDEGVPASAIAGMYINPATGKFQEVFDGKWVWRPGEGPGEGPGETKRTGISWKQYAATPQPHEYDELGNLIVSETEDPLNSFRPGDGFNVPLHLLNLQAEQDSQLPLHLRNLPSHPRFQTGGDRNIFPPEGNVLGLVHGMARGGIAQGRNLELVGEEGPELVDLAPGTRVIPLKKVGKKDIKKLREQMGIEGMQDGGIVDPLLSLLPFGVRRALSGGIIQPTRRRLSRAAGLPVLSAQARQNLLPEELSVFNRLSREAGIPEGAFAQEQRSAFPGANLTRGRARFAGRVRR